MKKYFLIAIFCVSLVACQKNSKTESTEANSAVATESQKATSAQAKVDSSKAKKAAEPTQQANGQPVFKFEEMKHDFGEIKEGTIAKHTFKFTNVGTAPLIIKDAKASCGCTVPNYPKEPIAPNGTGEIVVEYNSTGRQGLQNKTITVTANTNPEITTLEIQANVNAIASMNGPIKK